MHPAVQKENKELLLLKYFLRKKKVFSTRTLARWLNNLSSKQKLFWEWKRGHDWLALIMFCYLPGRVNTCTKTEMVAEKANNSICCSCWCRTVHAFSLVSSVAALWFTFILRAPYSSRTHHAVTSISTFLFAWNYCHPFIALWPHLSNDSPSLRQKYSKLPAPTSTLTLLWVEWSLPHAPIALELLPLYFSPYRFGLSVGLSF